jgi:hypothetical protein
MDGTGSMTDSDTNEMMGLDYYPELEGTSSCRCSVQVASGPAVDQGNSEIFPPSAFDTSRFAPAAHPSGFEVLTNTLD